jgi:23S rRNA pseudouridine2605 synthase
MVFDGNKLKVGIFNDLCINFKTIMRKNTGRGRRSARQQNDSENHSKRAGRRPSGKRLGKSRIAGEEEKKKSFDPKRRFKKPIKRKDSVSDHTHKEKAAPAEGMRLNRFIANAGVCSRREADKYIAAGLVTINGKQVNELGTRVNPGDEVRFDGQKLNAEKKVYLLLNKPKDFVTTTDDPHADRTVMDIVRNACEERIYPVGRLDRNTTGLLLFTNDGDMSKKLTHPSHNMRKVYQVSLDKVVSRNHLEMIAEGIELEDGIIQADAISYIDKEDKSQVGIEIHSGKNRIVRRIFEHFGYRVKKLDRVLFAGLTKKNLPRGKYRFLTEKEVKFLKMI